MAMIGTGSTAHAGCVTTEPLPPELPENIATYAALCALPWNGQSWDPCPRPVTPVVDASRSHAQSFVVTATVHDDAAANMHALWWEVEYTAPGGTFVPRWIHRSTEGFPAEGLPPGSTVTFGVPGLLVSTEHLVRVAFEDATGKKSCWSGYALANTKPFAAEDPAYDPADHGSVSPAPPAGMGWRVEDLFDRPDTSERCTTGGTGDGLGPDDVWAGYAAANNPCPRIVDEAAYFRLSTTAAYVAEEAGSKKSFAEALVRVDVSGGPTTSKYNFQVETKVTDLEMYTCDLVNQTVVRSYAAKLIYGPRDCQRPTLFLVRGPEQYGWATCAPDGAGSSNPIDAEFGINCPNFPPLDQEDPAHPGKSKPVWLRVVATPVIEDPASVDLEAIAAWDCPEPSGGVVPDIGSCQTCTFIRRDLFDVQNGDCQPLSDVFGYARLGFHEKNYFVDTFRAGDSAAPTQGP